MTYLSGYRLMWIMVLFDLPVMTSEERKRAADFRNFLLDNSFDMVQFSVYIKSCSGKEQIEKLIRLIEYNMPKEGKVDILPFTDKQYENIVTLRGNKKLKRNNPDQYILFQPNIEQFLPESINL